MKRAWVKVTQYAGRKKIMAWQQIGKRKVRRFQSFLLWRGLQQHCSISGACMVAPLIPCTACFLFYHLCYVNLVIRTRFWRITFQTLSFCIYRHYRHSSYTLWLTDCYRSLHLQKCDPNKWDLDCINPALTDSTNLVQAGKESSRLTLLCRCC